MLADKFKNSKGEPIFNKKVSTFFIRLFLVFSLWFVCYTMLLRPGRLIDRPLTNLLTSAVTKLINVVGPSSTPIGWMENQVRPCTHLTKDNVAIFDIFDVCNGIDLMFIYLGVLFLLPYPLKRKIVYGIGGVAAIITPSPDWTSQFLVAIPLLFLYWISILLASSVERKRAKEEKEWS